MSCGVRYLGPSRVHFYSKDLSHMTLLHKNHPFCRLFHSWEAGFLRETLLSASLANKESFPERLFLYRKPSKRDGIRRMIRSWTSTYTLRCRTKRPKSSKELLTHKPPYKLYARQICLKNPKPTSLLGLAYYYLPPGLPKERSCPLPDVLSLLENTSQAISNKTSHSRA